MRELYRRLAGLTAMAALSACETAAPPPFNGTPDGVVRETRDSSQSDLPPVSDGAVLCREHQGTIAASSKADLAQLDYVRILRGDLVLTPTEGLWNQSVREIAGAVRISGTREQPVMAHVTLAAVSIIGGDLALSDTEPGMIDIYRLVSLGGSITGRDGGWGVWTPDLTHIGGSIDVRDAERLALTLDNLETLGGAVRIERTHGFTSLSLGRVSELTNAGDALRLVDNPELTTLSLSALRTIEGNLVITGNKKLVRADIDSALEQVIVVGTTIICGNAQDEPCR